MTPTHHTVAELPLGTVDEPKVRRIGPYRIERLLGMGGMGEVYLAEQHEPIRRQVALKVVRAGKQASERILARFDLERQLLALMQHPGIAQLFDAGVTESGAPYFAMEYVDGVALTEYCDHRQLTVAARLVLFGDLCAAVQHAHQKGVIHRDLKPSNLLVTERDGRPEVKVIDFGVAKAIRGDLVAELLPTQLDVAVGTFAFMSPEQLDRRIAADLDTRSDVYALGVLLYDLLSGLPPFAETQPNELIEQILRREAPPLSRRVAESEQREKIARRRGTDSPALLRQLAGDLEWIVGKALEKNPADRYAAVSELAADLERHLGHLPVGVGPPTWTYRAKKFVRRNRWVVGTAALVVASLLASVIGTSWALLVSKRSQALAQREAAKAQAASDFLREMLGAAAPGEGGREVRVLDVLDQASASLDGKFEAEPEVEASLRSTLGRTYLALGRSEQALLEGERALALLERAPSPRLAQRVALQSERGQALAGLGRFAEAETELLSAVALSAQLPGDAIEALVARYALASVYDDLSRFGEAEAVAREVAERSRRASGIDHQRTLEAESLLALILLNSGKIEESKELHRDLVPRSRRVLGEVHPVTLTLTNNLALLLTDHGDRDEALALLSNLVGQQRRIQGPDHPETLTSRHNLGAALAKSGQLAAAEREMREVLADRRRVLGPDHANTLFSLRGLAGVLNKEGRAVEAMPLAEEAYRRALATLGPEHEATERGRALIARVRELVAQSAGKPP